MGLFEAAGARVIDSPAGTAKLDRVPEHDDRSRHRPTERRLRQLAPAVDAVGALIPVGLLCAVTQQPQPLLTAALAGASWLAVGASKNRYSREEPAGDGAVLAVLRTG